MKHELIFSPEAVRDLKRLSARDPATVLDHIERHLRYSPDKTSRVPIKRLRGLNRPQYHLRASEFRVYYDITEKNVEILAIVRKSEAADWLEEHGV